MVKKRKKGKNKRTQNILIIVSILAMMGSGLFFGLRNGGGDSQNPENVPVKYAEVTPVGQSLINVTVEGVLDKVVLRPKNSDQLGQDEISRILSESFTGVSKIEVEYSSSYLFFVFYTLDPVDVSKSLESSFKISGGFDAYPVFYGSSDLGQTDLIGKDLEVGDSVRVLMMQRTIDGMPSLLGFVNAKVE